METIEIKHTDKSIPTSMKEVDSTKLKWACQTTNILDDQHISWSLFSDKRHTCTINSFNYGSGVSVLDVNDYHTGNALLGSIFVEPIDGEYSFSDVVVHKGIIKHISHRKNDEIIWEKNGDLYLKIHALINMHFNKYTGYICFKSKGRTIISVSLYVDADVLAMYPSAWNTNLHNIYNGRGWK